MQKRIGEICKELCHAFLGLIGGGVVGLVGFMTTYLGHGNLYDDLTSHTGVEVILVCAVFGGLIQVAWKFQTERNQLRKKLRDRSASRIRKQIELLRETKEPALRLMYFAEVWSGDREGLMTNIYFKILKAEVNENHLAKFDEQNYDESDPNAMMARITVDAFERFLKARGVI